MKTISLILALLLLAFALDAQSSSVTLAWQPPIYWSTNYSYNIYYSTTTNNWNTISGIQGTNWTVSGLYQGTNYYFAATTVANYGGQNITSSWSTVVSYTIPTIAPPTNFHIILVQP